MPLSSLSSSARRLAALSLLSLVGTAALVAAAAPASAVDTGSPVVISEVYGGGGNSGATYTNDFIELYNSSDQAVDLSTWSVQYAAAGGSSWQRTNLSGSVPGRSFFLVQEAAGTGGSTPLPAPEVTGTIPMGGSAGKVALVSNETTLPCGADCDTAPGVVDLVGYGNTTGSLANDFAGTGPAPTTSATTSAQRSPSASTNTGDNAADFVAAAPTPKAQPVAPPPPPVDCLATPTDPACQPGPQTIQDVQGSGFLSPLAGQTVERVAGVVTAVRATGSSPGFWIQQANADASRPAASSGIFVFTGTAQITLPAVGDAVLVTGKVSEFYAGGPPTTSDSISVTEITPTLVTLMSKGNDLPGALVITPTTVPGLYAPTPPSGNTIESISPVDPTRSTLEFWEAHEGMLVTVNDVRVVGPAQQAFGEIYVTTKPTELATPRGGTYIKDYANTPTGRLLVLPVDGQVPAANVGDVLSGATTGPVDWSRFGGYAVAATTLGAYVDHGLQPTSAAKQADDQLAIATYNVENLDPGDPTDKFARLAQGVVTNLSSPDVVALEEIQDNNGPTNDGVVAADQTLSLLTAAIKKAGGRDYRFAEIDPVNNQDGGEPGGNIRSAFLYDPTRVTLVPAQPGTSLEPVTVSTGSDGTATLSRNPGRVDPTSSAWTASRKPLAAEFVFQGRKVVVVANHFNSKGGDQSADGRFQPPNRASEVQRTQQATVLNAFVKQVLAADPNANVVLAGDFNDYQFSGPIQTLTDHGATLTDLITTLPENQRYTYVFNGVSQVLDHIFVTKPVTDVEYGVVHNNAEFADQASDHDPQVVRIRPSVRQGTLALDPATVAVGGSTTVRLAGWYPDRSFTVSLDGNAVGTVTTDSSGAGSTAVVVPPATTPGAHTVTVTSADGATASATLTVTSVPGRVAVAPRTVFRGLPAVVTLDGWTPGARVSVSLDGTTPLGSVRVGSRGSAVLVVVIPAGATRGSHTVVATADDGASSSTTVTVRSLFDRSEAPTNGPLPAR